MNIGRIEKLERKWRAIVIDGAFTRYWFFSHFLFLLAIFVPPEKSINIAVAVTVSFGLFLVYLSSTLLLSCIAAFLRWRIVEGVWLLLWVMGLLLAGGSCLLLIFADRAYSNDWPF